MSYRKLLVVLSAFNATFEVAVYVYGLSTCCILHRATLDGYSQKE